MLAYKILRYTTIGLRNLLNSSVNAIVGSRGWIRVPSFYNILYLVLLFMSCRNNNHSTDTVAHLRNCSCETKCVIKKAHDDISNGHLTLIFYGLIETGSFEDYYIQYLHDSESINVAWGGDMGDSCLEEYDKIMIAEIKKQKGEYFFKRVKQSVTEKYHVPLRFNSDIP